MESWISANLGTLLVCVILVAVVTGILYDMIKRKRKGASSCGCNCSGCPVSGSCQKKEK